MTTTALKDKADRYDQLISLMGELIESSFLDSNRTSGIKRLTVEVPRCDLLSWYTGQQTREKLFWSDRDNKFAVAGIHTADVLHNGDDPCHTELFHTIRSKLAVAGEQVRYFGGIKFDVSKEISEEWEKFGSSTFILPRFELIRFDSDFRFICNLIFPGDSKNKAEILHQLSLLDFSLQPPTPYDNEIVARTDFPGQKRWIESINSALAAFDEKKYEKIVLARKTGLLFKNSLKPDNILYQLYKNTSNCFHFCFQQDETNAFLGATPERLYFRNNRVLKCEAVAGTRRRDSDVQTDNDLAQELLSSRKDVKEHRFVVDSILEALSPYTSDQLPIDENNLSVLKLARVQHLLKRFKCELKPNISDFELVNSLHPTAAVGGYPKGIVLEDIYKLEHFDRGWYAAPVGWIGKDTAEFAVALRCGLVHDNQLNLYSGAGIITGSDPENEWDEIENKISNFLKALS